MKCIAPRKPRRERMFCSNTLTKTPHRSSVATVFCAVWHKQPRKEELLRSHWENLKRQTVRVEPCYIFDNGDTPPDWLDAPWHSFQAPLTIYEAWSAGVALSTTRFVMNLNLDDRLADNAVQALVGHALATNASLVGGEWGIWFDDDHLLEPFQLTDLYNSHFKRDWPPKRAMDLRLGSGTGERGTFGPATLWDVSQTGKLYPTHFANGEPILSIGDAIFWNLIKRKGLVRERLPMLIGRYLSDPSRQAEFRKNNDIENLREHGISPTSFGQAVLAVNAKEGACGPSPEQVSRHSPTTRTSVEEKAETLSRLYEELMSTKQVA